MVYQASDTRVDWRATGAEANHDQVDVIALWSGDRNNGVSEKEPIKLPNLTIDDSSKRITAPESFVSTSQAQAKPQFDLKATKELQQQLEKDLKTKENEDPDAIVKKGIVAKADIKEAAELYKKVANAPDEKSRAEAMKEFDAKIKGLVDNVRTKTPMRGDDYDGFKRDLCVNFALLGKAINQELGNSAWKLGQFQGVDPQGRTFLIFQALDDKQKPRAAFGAVLQSTEEFEKKWDPILPADKRDKEATKVAQKSVEEDLKQKENQDPDAIVKKGYVTAKEVEEAAKLYQDITKTPPNSEERKKAVDAFNEKMEKLFIKVVEKSPDDEDYAKVRKDVGVNLALLLHAIDHKLEIDKSQGRLGGLHVAVGKDDQMWFGFQWQGAKPPYIFKFDMPLISTEENKKRKDKK